MISKKVLKYISHLKCLIISSDNNHFLIDTYQWQKLITSSLLYLNSFKFIFDCICHFRDNIIIKKFQQF